MRSTATSSWISFQIHDEVDLEMPVSQPSAVTSSSTHPFSTLMADGTPQLRRRRNPGWCRSPDLPSWLGHPTRGCAGEVQLRVRQR
jgi:hypothetical protein